MEREGLNIKRVSRQLDVVIALLAAIATKDEDVTLRDKIAMLSGFGLNSSEIASVLNKKTAYVSKELSLLRSRSNDGNKLEEISKKLSILIAFIVRSLPEELDTKQSIKLLDGYGLSNTEIATILGMKPPAVSMARSRMKGKKDGKTES